MWNKRFSQMVALKVELYRRQRLQERSETETQLLWKGQSAD